jgi:hypothetical protein
MKGSIHDPTGFRRIPKASDSAGETGAVGPLSHRRSRP